MNEQEFYLSRMFISSNYSNIYSLRNSFTTLLPMQAIETYTPSLSNLHLTPFQAVNTVADDINPLNYRLTSDDFITLTLPNGQLLYALDPATGTSLWWALRRIARIITRAAVHSIPIDPSLPVALRAYVPQFQFDRIAMQRPAILSTLDPDCMNPLYGYTSRENIQAWFVDFQSMGRQAVQWIRAARMQSAYLGIYSGWDWDGVSRDVLGLEFPNRLLIRGTEGTQLIFKKKRFFIFTRKTGCDIDSVSYVLPSTCSSSNGDLFSDTDSAGGEDVVMEEAERSGKQSKNQLKRIGIKKKELVRRQIPCLTPTPFGLHQTASELRRFQQGAVDR